MHRTETERRKNPSYFVMTIIVQTQSVVDVLHHRCQRLFHLGSNAVAQTSILKVLKYSSEIETNKGYS